MGQALDVEETNVLTALADAFPQRLHVHQLAVQTMFASDREKLLRIIDRLLTRRLIECVPLRGAEGLADAANILITSEGSALLTSFDRDDEANTALPSQVIATVLNVLIASPSDVSLERDAVESAIHEWNANHHAQTGVMLNAVRWETHSYPAAGDRPQGIINKQIVDSGHFLIGIFGTRLGTPTGEAQSGTIEEIERFRKTGRHVALYFSHAPVPRTADRVQLEALEKYQRERQRDTLYFTFGTPENLRRLVTQHLPKIVSEVRSAFQNRVGGATGEHLDRSWRRTSQPSTRRDSRQSAHVDGSDDLNVKEIELLWTAAKDPTGEILHSQTLDGEGLRSNGKHFLLGANARIAAEWLSALRTLEERGFIEPLGPDRDFFRVSGDGYAAADQLDEFARWQADSFVLRARYMNAEPREIRLNCRGIVAIPTRYYPNQMGADGTIQRSIRENRSLLIELLDSPPSFTWEPNEVEFLDGASSKVEILQVDGIDFIRPACLKLPIVG